MSVAARGRRGCSTEASSLGLERALALRERGVYIDSGVSLRYVTRVSAVHDHQRGYIVAASQGGAWAMVQKYHTYSTLPRYVHTRYLAVPATWFPRFIEGRRLEKIWNIDRQASTPCA